MDFYKNPAHRMSRYGKATENDSGILFRDYAILWDIVDFYKTYFSRNTDLGPDSTPGLYYHHGMDPEIGADSLGTVRSMTRDRIGLWVESQIDKSLRHFSAIKRLVDARAIGYSVSAPPLLYREGKPNSRGVSHVDSFPIGEMTLTPEPAQMVHSFPRRDTSRSVTGNDSDTPNHIRSVALQVTEPPKSRAILDPNEYISLYSDIQMREIASREMEIE